MLENEIVNIYGAGLVDLASLENNALFSVACLMVLMGEGNISEVEACGVRLSAIDQSYLVRDYPIFGVDPADRSFTCLGTEDTHVCDCASWSPKFAPNSLCGRRVY